MSENIQVLMDALSELGLDKALAGLRIDAYVDPKKDSRYAPCCVCHAPAADWYVQFTVLLFNITLRGVSWPRPTDRDARILAPGGSICEACALQLNAECTYEYKPREHHWQGREERMPLKRYLAMPHPPTEE